MEKRDLVLESRRRFITREELEALRVLLPAALAIDGSIVCAVTSEDRVVLVSRGEATNETVAAVERHITTSLQRTGTLHTTRVVIAGNAAVTPDRVRSIATTPLAAHAVEGLHLTIGFERTPDETARRDVQAFLDRFSEAVEASLGRRDIEVQRRAIAEWLLAPDFQKYPGLPDHCRLVSAVAQRFATVLRLRAAESETVRIAALVHDVGLRLLDYDRIAAAPRLSAEQKRAVDEHPVIGAAMVEPLLGSAVAEVVLRHHERWDGTGYPGKLAGNRIPIAARILAIADAWVAMTASWAYMPSIEPGDAATRLREGAGTQFDPTFVGTFLAARAEIAD